MKKNLYKAAVCFGVVGMAVGRSAVAYGAWQSDGDQWQYMQEEKREILRSAWHQEEGNWYHFDESGFMETGWYLDGDGKWYFLNPISDGTKGKMVTGWQWIDGYCYYLSQQGDESHPLGAMYAKERTPDGYQVNQSGAWVDEQGNPVYQAGKGIQTRTGPGVNRSVTGNFGGKKGTGGNGGSSGSGLAAGRETGITDEDEINSGTQDSTASSSDSDAASGSGDNQDEESTDESGEENGGSTGSGDSDIGDKTSGDPAGGSDVSYTGTEKVNWQIFFTDLSTHQLHLMPSRSGSGEEGTDLTIYFQTQLTDTQGCIWRSKQQSPCCITISGPGNKLVYIEYEQTGEVNQTPDPWHKERQLLASCLDLAREEESRFLGIGQEEIPYSAFLVEDKTGCDLRVKSAASRLMPQEEGSFYVIGKNYVPDGSILAEIYGNEMEYSNMVEQQITVEGVTYVVARFQILRKDNGQPGDQVWTGAEKRHWNIGDVQERELNGTIYRFRCIDQNYGDETDRSEPKALFLCDTVIPADTGSRYVYEKGEDGTYDYRFEPGPVTVFGDTNSYKYSQIRTWLNQCAEEFGETEEIPTGISWAYEGSTESGSGSQMESGMLRPIYIGSQSMKDHIFILSVDEALKYRQWLWKFEGAQEENPESQLGTFCGNYWLRTPGKEDDQVYVADLIEKNIRPQSIKLEENLEDPELAATGVTGVRPAFVVRQY